MADSEKIEVKKNEDRGDFVEMLCDAAKKTNFKLLFFLFISFLFVSSDVFVGSTLSRINGAVEMGQITNYGTIIQGILLILLYIVFDILIASDFI